MPVLEPAIVTLLEPALLAATADDLVEHVDVPPDPGPGDPHADPPVVTSPRGGMRVQALLQRTVTHEVVGEICSANVADWLLDIEEPGSTNTTASSWDPIWEAVAYRTTRYQGRPVYEWDAKAYELLIGVDGEPVFAGVFRQPLDIGGDRVALPARTPEILFDDRPLGAVEAEDHLDGWGNFERYPIGSTPPGMTIPGGMTAVVVADDGVRGGKALEVTGEGWVRTPHVPLLGQDGVGTTVGVSAFGKWVVDIGVNAATLYTKVQRADSLVPSNPDETRRKGGGRPDSGSRWSDGPVGSGATMTEEAVIHFAWGELRGFAAGPTRYDLVRMQQGILTGFLTERPYSDYLEKLVRDAQHGDGGSSWGLTSRIESESTGSIQLTWKHNQHPALRECARMVDTNVDGGAAWTISPAWVMRIMNRMGADRRSEILLGPDEVLACRWAPDPGAEVDDYIGDTGRGSDTTGVYSVVSAPVVPNRHRIVNVVRPPDGTLNAQDAWTRRHAQVAFRRHVTCELDVRWALATEIARGDDVSLALVDGNQGFWTLPGRVVSMRWRPAEKLCTLSIGTGDV